MRAFACIKLTKDDSSFIRPTSADVADAVAPTPQHQHGEPKRLDKLQAGCMTLHGQVESTQLVPCQRVCSCRLTTSVKQGWSAS